MRPTTPTILLATAIASLGLATSSPVPAHAGPSPQENCVARKLTAQAAYLRCLYKADRRFIRTGDAETRDTRRATCANQLAEEYRRIERAYGAACPAPGLVDDAEAFLEACEGTAVASTLSGAFPTCGDGAINVIGELCDGSDVGPASCTTLGYASGTLGCKPDCTFDTSGCASACTTYAWVVANASPCSATCGGGVRTRTVGCEQNPGATVVDDALCASAGPKPATIEACNTQACAPPPTPTPEPTPAYVWQLGSPSPCSATCGGGIQTRAVTCLSLATNTSVDDSFCSALSPKPETLLTCNANPCT